MTDTTTLARTDLDLQYRVEQFLYREAAILDAWEFREWLDLLAEDIHYWAPIRTNRLHRERHLEIARPDEMAYFDETKTGLEQRVFRLETGLAWSEEPPTRTRHLVSNVRVQRSDEAHEYEVESAFLCWANRLERDVDIFAGKRVDLLREQDDGRFLIARRMILLDQATLLAKGISIFL